MKKYISIIIMLVLSYGVSAQISITGPNSLTTGNAASYTVSPVLPTILTGYTYVWSTSSTNATLSSTSGQTISITAITPGPITISVIAFKDALSPSYCATKSITSNDACAFQYRIDDVSCPGTGSNPLSPNSWKFQLVNSNGGLVPTSGWNITYTNPFNYFIIDSTNGSQMSGHPNPANQPGSADNQYMQFSVSCKIGGCVYYYSNYADGTCGTGQTGYITSTGGIVITGN